ncbi:MAG: hypothetical protein VXV96_03735 [Bdellovibrionota bacterium]|nr:hypothetical protein [Bdellovibrionota bacterium]
MFFSLILALFSGMRSLYSQEERIPLASIRQPSNDLIFEGNILTAEDAWFLQQNEKVDLSLLDPMESVTWKNRIENVLNPAWDEIPINESKEYLFKGSISSNQGIMRFNVLPEEGRDRVFTILLEKTLHTTLLRRNLLRKLGYQIAPMKYLKSLKVTFDNIEQRDQFLSRELPEATYGAPSRWLGFDHKELTDEQLTLTFNDVVAFMPQETDHYNVAMGVPQRRLVSRTLRSLLIPYAVVNLGESVNKFPWNVGLVDNESVVLPHFTYANMNTAIEDARWAARRLAKLNRDDWKEVVEASGFPKPVEAILIEKLISRRNSLLSLLEVDAESISFETNINIAGEVESGRLLKEDWDGYASRFAHGQPDSPFKDFEYFVFSKIQSSVLTNLMSLVNEKLSVFDPTEAKFEFIKDQFEEGLEHFVETGEFKEFGVGTWFSPVVNGGLILNRDIVVGNYLGTDNLVQLADTVGVSLTLGGIMGIENSPSWPVASVSGTVSAVRTYTHLKPVKTLKASFKEPYRNLMVPLLKRDLRKTLSQLGDLPNQDSEPDADGVDPRLKAIEGFISDINETLGVGESLLITDRLTPRVFGNGSLNMMETRVSLGGGVQGAVVRRLHLYRKDPNTIHVYEDKGRTYTLSLNAGIDHYIPVVKVDTSRTKGKYKVRFHQVNINGEVSENPDLFSNAIALSSLIEEGSSELLEVREKPYIVEGDFLDKSTKFSFLVWKAKYLKGDNDIVLTTPGQQRNEFVSLTSQSQSGINYQSFVYDVINYYLKDLSKDLPITPQLDVNRFQNPGQSIFGVSETLSARFEARKNKSELKDRFIGLTDKREGWSASKKKLQRYIDELNTKYGTTLFNVGSVNDAQALQLFEISVSTNIYEKGISNIENVSQKTLEDLGRRYGRERWNECRRNSRRNRVIRTARTLIECGNLGSLMDKVRECSKLTKGTKKKSKCALDLAKKMVKDLEFNDFLKIVGVENVFVHGAINGFRKESEILNAPIRANTIGRVRSKYWNGPLDRLRDIIGIQGGELNGSWIRESL